MEIKLFGKSLFKFGKGDALKAPAFNKIKESKYLIDFYQDTGGSLESFIAFSNVVAEADSTEERLKIAAKAEKKPESGKKRLTPKEVHQLEMLHDKSFRINTDPKYVDEQIQAFSDKLSLIQAEEYDMRRGTNEIASVLQRLENRKRYAEFKDRFDEFPYTTTSRIAAVINDNDYLKIGQVAQFIADMPKEASDAMKRYNEACKALCGKQAVFYVIADKKDFQKSDRRRDPILLAQSPFGHFWQILGAWDKEMILLEEL